ncbi:MAG TPA: DNA topoisomerase, partial [Candidatus Paceibacterota bacterium]|nr:DNA topoisomerase [Candidatus Paceibacterota bacterium]
TTLAKTAQEAIAGVIETLHGKELVEIRSYQTKSKNAQEAHEAIRPTHFEVKKSGTTDDQKKLYQLIWERAVASQMVDARIARTKISATMGTKDFPEFSATGSRVIFPGWLLVDTEARGEDVELPKVTVGESLTLLSLDDLEKQTQPPSRYTEAGLVKELEARGIGRPSTYASIMSTLEERGYVTKEGRTLFPTDTGDVVSTFVEKNFETYISDDFTAEMEQELDEIAAGEREYVKTLKEFYTPFSKDIKEKDKLDKLTTIEPADPKFKCPKCGSGMVVKLGRGGKFLSCDRYPDCDGALTITGEELPKDKVIGIDPETGLEIKAMTGRFGPYVQLGEKPAKGTKKKKGEKAVKPKMASIPKEVDPATVTLEMALKYLSIPRTLGTHPVTGKDVTANNGRFGPYVAHDGNFRSIKSPLDVYTITLDQALELLAQEKKPRGFQKKKKE